MGCACQLSRTSLCSATYLYRYPLSVVHSTSTTCLALFILFCFQSYIEIIGIVPRRITLLCFLLFLALCLAVLAAPHYLSIDLFILHPILVAVLFHVTSLS
jgi:hypothetical protein